MQLKNLDFLLEKCKSAPRMTLAVACPQGDDILEAVVDAAREGVVDPVLVGNRSRSEAIAEELGLDLSGIAFVDEPNDALAAEKAVKMVSSGEAHLLMKGNVKTAVLLKAVLNKEWGLRSGSLLSHLFLFQVPRMPGVIGMSDGGMTMYPDLPTKVGIVENAVWAYHRIGVECPKIAALAAVEVVNPDMQATLDAAALAQMNRRGQIKGCLIDGPLALDNAVSAEAARIKGIDSPVAGEADMLLVPSIEAGNFVGKVMMYMSGGKGAGVILGARRPIVLTSRFDNAETKRLSIAFGAVLSMS
ncbi:MAG: bifunctional enoyl-CoA hydratase/phosphate acetyltransferase [Synergistaceae bacterium]|jgi:phosphate butyryltransferase|nr:bifunctional enoyl-CoA hydratase/phosphate acetyltransferase [Synergistaceae bacterium]